MIWLTDKLKFPPYKIITKNGIIALGGDLSVKRLKLAYQLGIFPWYTENEPIIWYCPDKRMVLFPNEIKISKSMQQVIRKNQFVITNNQAFKEVIYQCKNIHRKNEFGTWITDDMEQAYFALHKKGWAKSIEVWHNNQLVGGLYGVDLGNGVFSGESMFSKISNASKIAFIHLATKKSYSLIDCQIYNTHLASLGAREISRKEFLEYL